MNRSEDFKFKISMKTFMLEIIFHPPKKKIGEIRMWISKYIMSVCPSEQVMFGMGFVCFSV